MRRKSENAKKMKTIVRSRSNFTKLAKEFGVCTESFRAIRSGRSLPSLRIAVALEKWSDGELPATGWIVGIEDGLTPAEIVKSRA